MDSLDEFLGILPIPQGFAAVVGIAGTKLQEGNMGKNGEACDLNLHLGTADSLESLCQQQCDY